MRKLSIGVRLTLWYLLFFAVAQLLFGIGMWLILRDSVYDLVDDGLEQQIDDLKNFLQSQPTDRSLAKLKEEVNEAYAMEHPGDYLEVYVDNGELLYRSPFLQAHQSAMLSPEEVMTRPVVKSRKINGRHFRFILQKLNVNSHVYTVEMGALAEDAVGTLHLFRSYLLMFAPLLLLVAAAGGYWLSRRALSPVDALVRSAREVSGTKLHSRLQKLDTGDELQRLSDTLNQMLDRIESAFLRITEFTADASHELRTPRNWPCEGLEEKPNTRKRCATFCWRRNEQPLLLNNCWPWHVPIRGAKRSVCRPSIWARHCAALWTAGIRWPLFETWNCRKS